MLSKPNLLLYSFLTTSRVEPLTHAQRTTCGSCVWQDFHYIPCPTASGPLLLDEARFKTQVLTAPQGTQSYGYRGSQGCTAACDVGARLNRGRPTCLQCCVECCGYHLLAASDHFCRASGSILQRRSGPPAGCYNCCSGMCPNSLTTCSCSNRIPGMAVHQSLFLFRGKDVLPAPSEIGTWPLHAHVNMGPLPAC